MDAESRKGYILMERIYPDCFKNYLVKVDTIHVEECVLSEFSLYSGLITDGKEVVENEVGGALVRTKSAKCDEGGIATGFAVLSSVELV